MQNDLIAAFDFDGTIVSKDTGWEFYKWILKGSIIRKCLLLLFLPIGLLLALNSSSRTYGISIAWYIATAFQPKNIFRLRSEFVNYFINSSGTVVFEGALDKIRMHQKNGEKLIIISGCPLWLLSGVVKKLGLKNIELVGSKLSYAAKGLLFKEHCYSSNKIKMAREQGLTPEMWHYGYSDSTADIHWLKYCKVINVINPSHRKLAAFSKLIDTNVNVRKWG